MISDVHRAILVRVPRTGSTSTAALLGEFNDALDDGLLDPRWRADDRVRRYFSIAFVRNPWDRFLSAWKYVGATRRLPLEIVLRDLPRPGSWSGVRHGSLRARLAYASSSLAADALRLRSRVVDGVPLARTRRRRDHNFLHVGSQQTDFFMDERGEVRVDAVYPLESYPDALADLDRHLGLSDPTPRRLNSGASRSDYREIFTPRARELFTIRFVRDVELLGYSFEAGPGVPPAWRGGMHGLREYLRRLRSAG